MPLNLFIKKIQNQEIDIEEHINQVIEETKKINKEYNYLTTISEDLALQQAIQLKKLIKTKPEEIKNKKLLGVTISAKDSICVKNVESTAGSKILKGYKPVFNATVIEKAVEQGAIIIGKTAQDEFGFGSFSTNVGKDFDIPKNPFDKDRVCGGSSGGAAGLTQKATFPHIALSESTGGSIASPASFCGVFGLTPTYGLVSRYGLIDYANSLDKIGPMGKTIQDASLLLETISGHDAKDSTSLNEKPKQYNQTKNNKLKIGIIQEAFGQGNDKEIESQVLNTIAHLEDHGIKTEKISLPNTIKYGLETYYMIATSEASTNLQRYCGMRYGAEDKPNEKFNEYFTKIRSKNLGDEAKRRIILGTFARMSGYRDAYYIKAMQVRTLIINEYKKAFKKFDLLISPSTPVLPPKIKEAEKLTPLQNYMMDTLLVGPNLAGLPHLNVPVGMANNLPVGALFIANHLEEEKLIQIGNYFN